MTNERCTLIDAKTGNEIPLKKVQINGKTNGLTCQWKVTQNFENNEDAAIEAVFSFPLPSDATLNSLKIITGDKVITAQPEEKEEAFEKYDEAIEKGDGAFLMDQERPNFFVMSLGNVLPGQKVEIQLSMFQLLDAHLTGARISFPVAVVPRYSPDPSSKEAVEWERIEPEFTEEPLYGFHLNLEISQNSPIKSVESPSHPIKIELEGNNAKVTLSNRKTVPNTDIVISFELAEKFLPNLAHSNMFGHEHILFEVFPEFGDEGNFLKKKEVTFIVDCSGSMSGDSIEEAKNALQLCIRSLNEEDIFQIYCFGSSFKKLFKEPLTFNQKSLEVASDKISQIDSDMGGTEILSALKSAFESLEMEFSSIMLFTDGAVSNEKEVLRLARKNKGRCRIFSFGIGNGASEYLVKGIAENTGGKAEFIFPGERIEPKVLRQFNRLNSPFISDLEIEWGVDGIEFSPKMHSNIFSGEVVRFAGKIKEGKFKPKNFKVKLEGKVGDKNYSWKSYELVESTNQVPALWWAKQRIEELESSSEDGQSGSKQRKSSKAKKPTKVVEISKEYGILCDQTSYIGIEERTDEGKNDGQVKLRKIPAMAPAYRDMPCAAMAPMGIAGSVLNCFSSPMPSAQKSFMKKKSRTKKSMLSSLRESFTDTFLGDSEAELNMFDSSLELSSEPQSNEDKLMSILMQIKADGSFAYSDKLLDKINKTTKDIESKISDAPGHLNESEKKDYAITMLVKIELETTYKDQKEIWSAMHKKIEQWLKKQ